MRKSSVCEIFIHFGTCLVPAEKRLSIRFDKVPKCYESLVIRKPCVKEYVVIIGSKAFQAKI